MVLKVVGCREIFANTCLIGGALLVEYLSRVTEEPVPGLDLVHVLLPLYVLLALLALTLLVLHVLLALSNLLLLSDTPVPGLGFLFDP